MYQLAGSFAPPTLTPFAQDDTRASLLELRAIATGAPPRYPRSGVKKRYFVYILMSDNGTVLYVGVTGRLSRRVDQHAAGFGCEFTSKYHVTRLVYFEQFGEARDAITREKQIKGWTRKKKEELIRRLNPKLQDLRPKILDPQM